MKRYKGSGNPGVEFYEISGEGIILQFKNDIYNYLYNEKKPGKDQVNQMKALAEKGLGLTTYNTATITNVAADHLRWGV